MYLPQFHPIPENDEWWGKGFTEWINVVKAKPSYKGHYQPHLPADLGFYDLRLEEVRQAQATMAKMHGIYGFCYYHYWFSSRRILERPFQEVFETRKPDFPFMLCWANENWTRTWDGLDDNILLKQNYSEEDDRLHIQSLIPFFNDKRYIKIGGRPVFAIYRSSLIPDPKSTIKIWRDEALKHGLELYLCRFESFGENGKNYVDDGFDAGIDFQPFSLSMEAFKYSEVLKEGRINLGYRSKKWYYEKSGNQKELQQLKNEIYERIRTKIDYNEYVNHLLKNYRFANDYVVFPGAVPSWDNTARKNKNAFILHNANPAKFKEWISFLEQNYRPASSEENFIFINAWNEWAEGNHLEPCEKWGLQYLEAIKDVILKNA